MQQNMEVHMSSEKSTAQNTIDREKVIVKTSIIGIIANVFLAAFKAVIGVITGSIAITLDAVNNLSDALSSVITIVGTKLAGKKPDKKHPMGYGRIEYMSALLVAGIVLYAGLTSFVESVKKIIHPEAAEYTMVSLVIIAAAVVVKLVLGRFVKGQGEKVNSGSLIASGSDAMFDAVLSASVLASAIIFMISGISLEAFVGVVISVIIIKSGIEMMQETLSSILGERADEDMVKKIKKSLVEDPQVRGAYDLFINNYGPDRNYASVHVEVPDTLTAREVDKLTRRLQKKVFFDTGIILTGIGIYSHSVGDNQESQEIRDMETKIRKRILEHEWTLAMHGFYADLEEKEISLDVVFSFDVDLQESVKHVYEEIQELYPDFNITIAPDVDVS